MNLLALREHRCSSKVGKIFLGRDLRFIFQNFECTLVFIIKEPQQCSFLWIISLFQVLVSLPSACW